MTIFIPPQIQIKMKRILLFMMAMVAVSVLNAQQPQNASTENGTTVQGAKNSPAAQIEWLTWDEAVKRMEKEPRKIMIDVYTDWCGWCKKMDATTMKDPTVAQLMGESWYAVKMDGERKEDIIFKGRTYKFVAQGRRGYHELPAELMNGRMSYPTLVFLDEQYKVIQPLPGYRQAPELEKILAYFGGDFYKNTDWEKFSAEYKSPN